jgi:hypothetical protein
MQIIPRTVSHPIAPTDPFLSGIGMYYGCPRTREIVSVGFMGAMQRRQEWALSTGLSSTVNYDSGNR